MSGLTQHSSCLSNGIHLGANVAQFRPIQSYKFYQSVGLCVAQAVVLEAWFLGRICLTMKPSQRKLSSSDSSFHPADPALPAAAPLTFKLHESVDFLSA